MSIGSAEFPEKKMINEPPRAIGVSADFDARKIDIVGVLKTPLSNEEVSALDGHDAGLKEGKRSVGR